MPSIRDIAITTYPLATLADKQSNGTAEVTLFPAPGSNRRLRIVSLHATAKAANGQETVIFRNGASGATFYSFLLPTYAVGLRADRDQYFGPKGPVLTANVALMASIVAGTTGVQLGACVQVEDVV